MADTRSPIPVTTMEGAKATWIVDVGSTGAEDVLGLVAGAVVGTEDGVSYEVGRLNESRAAQSPGGSV